MDETRTVIVIGSVTSKQYKHARLSVLSAGYKPKIIRVDFSTFFLHDHLIHEEIGLFGPENEIEYMSDEFGGLEEEAVHQHLAQFGNFATIVMDSTAWNSWHDSDFSLLMHFLEAEYEYKRWLAYPDGQVLLID